MSSNHSWPKILSLMHKMFYHLMYFLAKWKLSGVVENPKQN